MPRITVHVPTPLQPFTDGRAELVLEADSVRAALERAGEQYPSLLHQVLTRDGEVRRYVNIFVRRSDIRQLGGLETELDDGDEIVIMPSVAGG